MTESEKGSGPESNRSPETDLVAHWDTVYSKSPDERLGWFETDLSPTLNLISGTGLEKTARILLVGAGSTTLLDELLKLRYSNLIASDLSTVALNRLKDRVGSGNVEFITDDLTNPQALLHMPPVDLWIDRAVLHFFTESKDQDTYFKLLKSKTRDKGFVILAEFNLQGATKCSGLPVFRYDKELYKQKLGPDFELLESFDYTYKMPSGEERPYVYALFRKNL